MSDYAYRPRLGYDIRVRPPEGAAPKKRVFDETKGKTCEIESCGRPAIARLAVSPRDAARVFLCAEHAKQHNARWNFFEGLSATEAEAARRAALYGDRPTWKMSKNERQTAYARTRGPADLADAFGLFGATAPGAPAEAQRNGRPLSRLQSKAFATLDLNAAASGPDIRRRYAEMLRRFHPDANGGDRSAETQLQEVVRAHQILKKAGFC